MYHYHCIISQACFSSKTLKMQSFLLCVCVCVCVCVCAHIKGAGGIKVQGIPSRDCGNLE